jgi:hypothetical protein
MACSQFPWPHKAWRQALLHRAFSTPTYLHGVRLAGSCLPIAEQADLQGQKTFSISCIYPASFALPPLLMLSAWLHVNKAQSHPLPTTILCNQ